MTHEGMTEIRFEVPTSDARVLDGFCQATGATKAGVMRDLLLGWSADKKHEVTVICRVADINPFAPDSDRK